jgi:hypothetical protein
MIAAKAANPKDGVQQIDQNALTPTRTIIAFLVSPRLRASVVDLICEQPDRQPVRARASRLLPAARR